MALYLDQQTRPYLERMFKEVKPNDFIGERIKKMLEGDRTRLENIESCEHVTAQYQGKKTCCSKCGSFFEPGMREEWNKD